MTCFVTQHKTISSYLVEVGPENEIDPRGRKYLELLKSIVLENMHTIRWKVF